MSTDEVLHKLLITLAEVLVACQVASHQHNGDREWAVFCDGKIAGVDEAIRLLTTTRVLLNDTEGGEERRPNNGR